MDKEFIIEKGRYYYLLCKCGNTKNTYKSPMCSECYSGYLKGRRWRKDPKVKEQYSKKLNEFVIRVRRRNHIVSMEDIFVDLITLYNFYSPDTKEIDSLPVNKQILEMWKYVQKKYDKLNEDN